MKKLILIFAALCLCACSANKEKLPEDSNVEAPGTEIAEPSKKVVTITAVGDCTFATDSNAPKDGSFVGEVDKQNEDYTYFLKNVADIFKEDDLTIVNFEGTLSEKGKRESKQFAFRGKPEYTKILTSSSVEAANLANNHSKDYGSESYTDTVKNLEDAGITTFNGTDTKVLDINGVKVGLVGIYALNDTRAKELEPAMEKVKSDGAELIVVNVHWGQEGAKTPNSSQRDLAHKAVDLGADLVLGHHPHVLQGLEKYDGKYIVYSLGNFCFGGNRNPSDKDTMIFRQTFTLEDGIAEDDDNIVIIPCSVSSESGRNNYQPTPLDGDEAKRVMDKIHQRTESIK